MEKLQFILKVVHRHPVTGSCVKRYWILWVIWALDEFGKIMMINLLYDLKLGIKRDISLVNVGESSNPHMHNLINITSSSFLAWIQSHFLTRSPPHHHLHPRHQIHCHPHHPPKITLLPQQGYRPYPHCQLSTDWLCSQKARFCSWLFGRLGFPKNRLPPSFTIQIVL